MSKRELSEVAKALIAAKKRIENPENWWDGTNIWQDGSDCALGALVDSAGFFRQDAVDALRVASRELFGYPPSIVNDQLGHSAVMRMYDHAIATEIQRTNAK